MPEASTFVILSPGFPENESDTTCLPAQQQFVLNVQESFPAMNIIVLAFHYPYKAATYKWNNVTVMSFDGRNKGKLSRLLLWLKIWRSLSGINKRHRVIGVFSFWCTECAFIGKYFAKRHSLKHFTWILGQDARKSNRFVKLIRPQQNELVAMSHFLANEFERNHHVRPAHVIPNGIDTRNYAKEQLQRFIDVLGVGSLISLKQYNVFIEMISHAKIRFPHLRAVICGKGPEQLALQEQICKLQLEQNVSLTGEFQHPGVLKTMQQSKIFLHTSSYEGFSTVCLEALYAGAHVISFCRPVVADIPHWHIVTTRDEMLEQLLLLLENDTLDHAPVMPYSMKDTAVAVMRLFEVKA